MHTLPITDPTARDTALATLRAGGLIICPTETIYGILADAENPATITRLLEYKRRPAGKAISIAVDGPNLADRYVTRNNQATKLYSTLLPGPVTVVSASRRVADTRLESEFGTLGIRWPDHQFLLDLITHFGRGVTATSANSAGRKTPYSIPDILDNLSSKQKNLIDLILDAGTLPARPPSLVIDTTPSTPIVMRTHQDFRELSSDQLSFISHSDTDTRRLAGQILLPHLESLFHTGLLITLDGDLGAGKTTFTQGLAACLGITQTVNSPTYTYLKEYPFTKFDHAGTLYHLDVWTIDRPEMLAALQFSSLLAPGHLVVVEWWHQIESFLPPDLPRLNIQIISDPDNPDQRNIFVHDFTKNIDKKE